MQIAIYVTQNIPQHKLGHPQMPIALLPTEERDASYSILVHAGSEYPTVRYRAHPSIDML